MPFIKENNNKNNDSKSKKSPFEGGDCDGNHGNGSVQQSSVSSGASDNNKSNISPNIGRAIRGRGISDVNSDNFSNTRSSNSAFSADSADTPSSNRGLGYGSPPTSVRSRLENLNDSAFYRDLIRMQSIPETSNFPMARNQARNVIANSNKINLNNFPSQNSPLTKQTFNSSPTENISSQETSKENTLYSIFSKHVSGTTTHAQESINNDITSSKPINLNPTAQEFVPKNYMMNQITTEQFRKSHRGVPTTEISSNIACRATPQMTTVMADPTKINVNEPPPTLVNFPPQSKVYNSTNISGLSSTGYNTAYFTPGEVGLGYNTDKSSKNVPSFSEMKSSFLTIQQRHVDEPPYHLDNANSESINILRDVIASLYQEPGEYKKYINFYVTALQSSTSSSSIELQDIAEHLFYYCLYHEDFIYYGAQMFKELVKAFPAEGKNSRNIRSKLFAMCQEEKCIIFRELEEGFVSCPKFGNFIILLGELFVCYRLPDGSPVKPLGRTLFEILQTILEKYPTSENCVIACKLLKLTGSTLSDFEKKGLLVAGQSDGSSDKENVLSLEKILYLVRVCLESSKILNLSSRAVVLLTSVINLAKSNWGASGDLPENSGVTATAFSFSGPSAASTPTFSPSTSVSFAKSTNTINDPGNTSYHDATTLGQAMDNMTLSQHGQHHQRSEVMTSTGGGGRGDSPDESELWMAMNSYSTTFSEGMIHFVDPTEIPAELDTYDDMTEDMEEEYENFLKQMKKK